MSPVQGSIPHFQTLAMHPHVPIWANADNLTTIRVICRASQLHPLGPGMPDKNGNEDPHWVFTLHALWHAVRPLRSGHGILQNILFLFMGCRFIDNSLAGILVWEASKPVTYYQTCDKLFITTVIVNRGSSDSRFLFVKRLKSSKSSIGLNQVSSCSLVVSITSGFLTEKYVPVAFYSHTFSHCFNLTENLLYIPVVTSTVSFYCVVAHQRIPTRPVESITRCYAISHNQIDIW